ncbi:hypothetical protein ABT381_11020 [Streptomyces sp. NPDC000151]|uniref:hypothetical protein n=1 Tax=Streptomyces sp. NPDC000151 TaxID=3154244 RepID=UPI00332799F9
MDRRMRPTAALRALLAVFALVLGGLSPTAAAAATTSYEGGAPYASAGQTSQYASAGQTSPPHAHSGPTQPGCLHALPRTGRATPAEQHAAHPAPGLDPASHYAPRLRALPWPSVRREADGRPQCAAGLWAARAPPLSHR